MSAPPPPPRRTVASTSSSARSSSPVKSGWKATSKAWGLKAMDKAVVVSDWAGGHLNNTATKLGSEAFYPVSDDFPNEMNKAARILRAFTVDGVETTIETEVKGIKRQRKVLRKIPPKVLQSACGLAIFTSFRSGIAPFGGAGGAGVVVARLEDGSWSAPSSMSPNSLTAGFMLGVDIFDAVLVIRTPAALKSFASHKATLGSDIGVAAGPFGAGAALEVGIEKAPVLSYVKSRGLYAGVQLVGQVFVDRFDENAKMYHWPGVKAGDILSGKVRVPPEAAALQLALKDACSGRAQRLKHDALDVVVYPEVPDELVLEDGEVLKLPPTPSMTPPGHESDEDTRPPKQAPPDLIDFSRGGAEEHEQAFNERFAAASILPPPPLPSRRPAAPAPAPEAAVSDEELKQIQLGLNPLGAVDDDAGAAHVKLVGAGDVNQSNSTSPTPNSESTLPDHHQPPPPSYDETADGANLRSSSPPPALGADEAAGAFPDDKKDAALGEQQPSPPPLPLRSSRPASPAPVAQAASTEGDDADGEMARRKRAHHEANQRADADLERQRRADEGEFTSVAI